MKLFLIFSLIVLANCQHNPNFAPGRSGIVHLFEWRWVDIAIECERWLGPRGFGGVQVSPPNENIIIPGRPWWERYQPVSYRLVSRSGSETDFQTMVTRCNAVGVRIYVDVLINHMTGDHANIVGTGGSTANTVQRNFPAVPWIPADFNTRCTIVNWNDPAQVRNCELYGLHDLNQGLTSVRNRIIAYLNHLVDLGVAGFRIDSARHMWPVDLAYIYGQVKNLNFITFPPNSRPFIFQEIWHDNRGSAAEEYTHLGTVTEFRYGEYLARAFRGGDGLVWLQNFGEAWNFLPSADALVFVDNHDTQRANGLNYQEKRAYIMAEAFSMAWPYGIVKLMSSYQFSTFDQGPPNDGSGNIASVPTNPDGSCGNGWVCEHRWNEISNMVGFKNVVGTTTVQNWWSNGANQIAFSRGHLGFIAFNTDTSDLNAVIQTGLAGGNYCDVISGSRFPVFCSGIMVSVDAGGFANIIVPATGNGGVLAIHVDSRLLSRHGQLEN